MPKVELLNQVQEALLSQYAEGCSPHEIDESMGISEITVLAILDSAKTALGATSMVDAATRLKKNTAPKDN